MLLTEASLCFNPRKSIGSISLIWSVKVMTFKGEPGKPILTAWNRLKILEMSKTKIIHIKGNEKIHRWSVRLLFDAKTAGNQTAIAYACDREENVEVSHEPTCKSNMYLQRQKEVACLGGSFNLSKMWIDSWMKSSFEEKLVPLTFQKLLPTSCNSQVV